MQNICRFVIDLTTSTYSEVGVRVVTYRIHERKVFQSLSVKTNAQRRYASSRNNNETCTHNNEACTHNNDSSSRNDEREIGRRMQNMVRWPPEAMDGQMHVGENVRRMLRMRWVLFMRP